MRLNRWLIAWVILALLWGFAIPFRSFYYELTRTGEFLAPFVESILLSWLVPIIGVYIIGRAAALILAGFAYARLTVVMEQRWESVWKLIEETLALGTPYALAVILIGLMLFFGTGVGLTAFGGPSYMFAYHSVVALLSTVCYLGALNKALSAVKPRRDSRAGVLRALSAALFVAVFVSLVWVVSYLLHYGSMYMIVSYKTASMPGG